MTDFPRKLVSISAGSGFEDDVAKEMLCQLAEFVPDVSTGDGA